MARVVRHAVARGDARVRLSRCARRLCSAIMSARPIEERAALEVEWERGTRSRYHNVWLRDHCQCAECINETTRQRQVCSASIPEDLVVASASLTSLGEAAMDPTIDSGDADVLRLDWSSATDAGAAHRGHISVDWLQRNAYWHVDVEGEDVAGGDDAPPLASSAHDESGAQRVVLWDADFDSRAAEVQYDSILRDDETLRASMNLLHTLGFALVKGTPETVAATELVAKRMCGYVRQTLYGGFSAPHYGMWDTAPKEGTEVNDTAFTNVALPPHNDGCYWRDPPGLQLFNCAERSEDTKGGLTVLVDGFRVADELRASDPDTFQFFIKTQLPYFCVDEGVRVRTMAPMFELDHHGEVTSIRYNNDDRGSLSHLDRAAIERFYPAWRKVTTMLRAERSKLEILLEPGTLLIVNNHRVLHGRTEFLGRRNLVGCYLDRDMFDGRRRVLNSATEPAVWAE